MNRVLTALQEGRCVLAIGGRALQSSEILGELRRRSAPSVALGKEPVNPAGAITAEALAPVTSREGGVLVLVEPEGADDSKGLTDLGNVIASARFKPKLYVAARAFNPFALPANMRMLKLEQLKFRAVDFLSQLPVAVSAVPGPAAAPAPAPLRIGGGSAPAPVAPKASAEKVQAPRPLFVGREEEQAALKELVLADGGPIVVHGTLGVGRRWLVDQVLAATDLKRLPDLTFGRGVEDDSFFGRLAIMARSLGDDRLHKALANRAERPTPVAMAALVVELLQAEIWKGKAWVIFGLPWLLDRRDNSFYRDGRLELALKAILTSQPALRLIFVSDRVPTFYREGEALNVRKFKVEGIRGKMLNELFSAWKAPEFPRDRFGPISERTHGHAMASRFFALTVREGNEVDQLLEQPRFLKAAALEDLEALRRHLKKRVEALPENTRHQLAACALLREPGRAEELQVLGISRNDRLALLAAGLLEQTVAGDERRYYVHPLVSEHLGGREVEDFDTMMKLAEHLQHEAAEKRKAGDKVGSFILAAESNRLLVEARKGNLRLELPYPDNDALVDNVRGMMRQKKPRFDIARMRLNEAMRGDPRSPELAVLDAQLRAAERASQEQINEAWSGAEATCPTPELFHSQASFWIDRNARGKAASALQTAINTFPENARLHRRLATIQLTLGRYLDAVDTLKKARDLEPLMPDNYSALSEAYMNIGMDRWEEAVQCIEEALRLDPTHPFHLARAGSFLRRKAIVDTENRETMLAQAEEHLRKALETEKGSPRILIELATIIIDRGGDLEQADWFLGQAQKRGESPEAMLQRARVLLRKKMYEESERILERLTRKEPNLHGAYAVRGELWLERGQIFFGCEQLKTAVNRTGKHSPERVAYEAQIKLATALIESGQATELARQADESGHSLPKPPADGPRREAGKTTRRRKGKGGEAAQEAAPEGAEQAEASAEEASAEEEGGEADEEGGQSGGLDWGSAPEPEDAGEES